MIKNSYHEKKKQVKGYGKHLLGINIFKLTVLLCFSRVYISRKHSNDTGAMNLVIIDHLV